jgi:hypothetical protein
MTEKKIKGDIYEKHVCEIINKTSKAWLLENIPKSHLINSGLLTKQNKKSAQIDTGIDIIEFNNNKYTFIQCKYGYKRGVKMKDIAGFSFIMLNHPETRGKIYYTSKLSRNITKNHLNDKNKFVKLPFYIPKKNTRN